MVAAPDTGSEVIDIQEQAPSHAFAIVRELSLFC